MNKPKVALVSGGSSGIGKAIVDQLVSSGCRVIVLDLYPYPGENVESIHVDLADLAELSSAIAKVKSTTSQLDILVNNAAVQHIEPLSQVDFDHFDQAIAVNLRAPFYLIQQLSNLMPSGSQILNISSIHGSVPRKDKYAYDFSKAGLDLLTKEVALELAPKGIRVNTLSIGATDTPMNDFNQFPNNKVKALENIPLKTILSAQEVAKFAKHILLDTSSATGSIFVLDGGRSL